MLNDAARRILSQIELDAELSAAAIARRLRFKTNRVQRIIARLIERDIIVGKTAVLDIARLGLYEFGLNISLGNVSRSERSRFEAQVQKEPHVSWCAAVGGSYDYMLNITAADPATALEVLNKLLRCFRSGARQKHFCIRTERLRFWRGYLDGGTSRGLRYHLGKEREPITLSATDQRVLEALNDLKHQSLRELARTADVPLSTFLRRIEALRSSGLLLGFGYRLNLDALGLAQFRLLISTRHADKALCEKLLALGMRSGIGKLLTVGIGPWNYEFEVDAQFPQQVREFAELVEEQLEHDVEQVEVVPIFRHIKFITFPAFAGSPLAERATAG